MGFIFDQRPKNDDIVDQLDFVSELTIIVEYFLIIFEIGFNKLFIDLDTVELIVVF